ncbi:Hypothetical Protein FCC1311_063922 [Hondaea fermentalgiana]|uniref:Uncharacterized protein n=1 Tax=Hondaea fermentalgiana TaxID=2315210 RepID=A0A2R5GH04_9STRA|nr:Hypothetical Protein FCC1311_063922 [Hondaea fermentalgiana]|eukprot:GBG30172.1 Hypothetical Protein FCC1311_063922 [Hondaea fermentalgiana]
MLARAARSRHVRNTSWESLAAMQQAVTVPAPRTLQSVRALQQAAVPDPIAVQDKLNTNDAELTAEEPFVILDRRGEFFYEPVPCVDSRYPIGDGRPSNDDIDDLLFL